MSPRTGRPTDNPKSNPIHVRLDDESKAILENIVNKRKFQEQREYDGGLKS